MKGKPIQVLYFYRLVLQQTKGDVNTSKASGYGSISAIPTARNRWARRPAPSRQVLGSNLGPGSAGVYLEFAKSVDGLLLSPLHWLSNEIFLTGHRSLRNGKTV